jgi:hypothetical protein
MRELRVEIGKQVNFVAILFSFTFGVILGIFIQYSLNL